MVAENARRNAGMKIQTITITVSLALLFTGCAGVNSTPLIGDTAGAAGGALIGHKLGKGKPLSIALGAGGGVLLGESLHAGSRASAEKAYVAGYEKGQSDSAKRQYQALTERQRLAPQSDDAVHLRLFDVPLPEREQNGVILAPGTATLRIQQ